MRPAKPAVGFCSICRNYGELTCDHVPPKGCYRPGRVEVKSLLERMCLQPTRSRLSQSGVHFRTICGVCNNDRLGRRYDPALMRVSAEVGRIVRSTHALGLVLPDPLTIVAKPQEIARAVIGHLLASVPAEFAGEPPAVAPMQDAMRQYFLDPNRPMPNELEVFYWAFPSSKVVILRSVVLADVRDSSSRSLLAFDLLKFFPLGFMVTWQRPATVNIGLPLLLPARDLLSTAEG